ncbi:unnamed protein product [Cuscuta campestris]|uniref:DUF4219 domain-containing protein n=1 Tax=Cuscuta campestris TaxID=132261 RepID=A0A484KU69_9ASTE|nr:unnamed protein product [Cuscuta campestris]
MDSSSRNLYAGIGEGQSTSRPPLFDGTNYTYWKERMRIYIRSTNFQLWLVIKNGEETPMKKVNEKLVPKTEDEFDAEDIKKVENYAKAINMLYCAVNPDDYRKISCCTTAKEMWDKLEVTYEGLPIRGDDIATYGGDDWILNNKAVVIRELGITNLIRHSGAPTIHSAPPDKRLLLYIITRILRPRDSSHTSLFNEDLKAIHAIIHGASINWVKFVMIHMADCASIATERSLPYAFLVMDLIISADISIASPDTKMTKIWIIQDSTFWKNDGKAKPSMGRHDRWKSFKPSSSSVPGQKLRRLKKQFPSSTPALKGSRVELGENIMALFYCQVTDQGFADATDMVGPSIEVRQPSRTQTTLDAPPGFFTLHLASLKKGLQFPLHSLFVEFLNEVDFLPCQLVPNSHRYIDGYLIKCKEVGVEPTLDHFLLTFKLARGHGDWASYASLFQRSSKLLTSDKKGSTKDWKPFFVFVSTWPESSFTGSGHPSFHHVQPPKSNATLLSITRKLCGKGSVEIMSARTEESLKAWATLGMIELAGREQDHQFALDEVRKAAEAKHMELQGEVTRLARELREEKSHYAQLKEEKTSLSSEVGSVSARVVELEVEPFKTSPKFTTVAMERMSKLVVEWLKTEPETKWMVREAKKAFHCGLFWAQQVFRSKLALLPKGTPLADFGFPPLCDTFAEFDPSSYMEEENSDASNGEEEMTVQGDQNGKADQEMRASSTATKAGKGTSSSV